MPFYNWNEMTKKNLVAATDSVASIIIGENITLNRSVNQPGDEARPHTHGCEQLINVVSGTAWFLVGDEEKTVTVGDIVHIPAGMSHGFKNKSDEEFVYLSFKNISEDWPPQKVLNDKSLRQKAI
jgi:quercetin dioxygenase-like cupin family protein